MEALRLTACTPMDLEVLRLLSLQTFTEAFQADNDPEDFHAYLQKAFSEQQLRAELAQPDTRFFFLRYGNSLAGYCKLNTNQAQTELREPTGMEIERIYVLGSWQGRGFGAWMLQQIRELALAEGKEYLWLGVWEHNPGAIRFYERQGFVTFDRHPYYIGTDRQMDLMMRLGLHPNPPTSDNEHRSL